MKHHPHIHSVAFVPFISSTDEIASTLYYSKAYAIDSERRNVIIFNPSKKDKEYVVNNYANATIVSRLEDVPECYVPLVEHVNNQIESNLKRIQSPSSLRWIGAYAHPYRGIIRIVSTYHLHGIDANHLPDII